ncbi:hypothetical protein [Litorimonas haliclonae]|uniref:hypothetical protein n=1 Tax=Litorimonas haliclonae TaxID=2081977 RepID=UPI0039EEBA8C
MGRLKSDKIPFFENGTDNVRCMPACVRSAVSHLLPEEKWSGERVEKLVGFQPSKMTWPMKSYLELSKLGLDVVVYDPMDFERFATSPKEYMTEAFGEDLTKLYYEKSDVEGAVKDTKNLLESDVKLNIVVPDYSNLKQLHSDGYLSICHIDQNQLIGLDTPGDHSILVFDVTDNGVTAHNPGPPPTANQYIERDFFNYLWSYPTDEVKTILALKNPKIS